MKRARVPVVEVDGIPWPVLGAQVAIIRDGRVLLQFRPWPPGWELPGGHCEDTENPETTATREVEEETGYRIRITGLAGVYTWAGLRTVGDVLYLAEVIGGTPKHSIEAWSQRFVAPGHLPRTVFPWVRLRVIDALAVHEGAPPVHRVQPVTLYHVAAFATAWLRSPLDKWRRRGHRGSASGRQA
jgi:8-oxo-dGTP diphosphatase